MMTDGESGAVQTSGKPPHTQDYGSPQSGPSLPVGVPKYRLAHKNARRRAKLTKRSSNRQAFGAASV
jgi:hypothetical protein